MALSWALECNGLLTSLVNVTCTIVRVQDAIQFAARPKAIGLVHLLLSYVAALVGFLIGMLIAGIGMVGSEQGLFFRLTNVISGEPVFAPDIVTGFVIGWLAYKRVPSRFAFASWIVPGVILFWNVIEWQRTMSQYDSTWSTFFGTGCGGSECLYEVFLTAPFYTAIAYAGGALLGHLRRYRQTEVSSS
jgi:hypothetical protein